MATGLRALTAVDAGARSRIALTLLVCVTSMVASGCAVVESVTAGRPHPLAQVRRFGLIFLGDAPVAVPMRLQPGVLGDAAVMAEGLAAGLLWMPGWLTAGPLWVPLVHAEAEAACRDAVAAEPGRATELLQRLATWDSVQQMNRRLAERLSGRAPDRMALTAPVPGDASARQPQLLAQAAGNGLDAVALFEVKRVELRSDSHDSCAVHFFVAGQIRALRVPDGAPLELRLSQTDQCKRNAAIPLAQLLRDESMLHTAMDAATDCAVRELIEWTDLPWQSY